MTKSTELSNLSLTKMISFNLVLLLWGFCILLSISSVQAKFHSSLSSTINGLAVPKTTKPNKINKVHNKSKKIKVIETTKLSDEELQVQEQKLNLKLQILSGATMVASGIIYLGTNRIDTNHPQFIFYSRILFGAYLFVTQLIYFLLKYLINKADNQTLIDISDPLSNASDMFSTIATKLVKSNTITIKEYDSMKNDELLSSLLPSVAMTLFFHLRKPKGSMLLITTLTGFVNFFTNPLIQLYILRFQSIGNLKRPFVNPLQKMFEGFTGKLNEQNTSETKLQPTVETVTEIESETSEKPIVETVEEEEEEIITETVTETTEVTDDDDNDNSDEIKPIIENNDNDIIINLDEIKKEPKKKTMKITKIKKNKKDRTKIIDKNEDISKEIDNLLDETSKKFN